VLAVLAPLLRRVPLALRCVLDAHVSVMVTDYKSKGRINKRLYVELEQG
jgi:hypothetical protein